MKIIIINGSPRKNGATAKILHKIEKVLLEHKNVDVEFVNISEINMSPCSGCCSCYKTGHCYMNDDAEKLSEKIALADGLIMGSPTYASNISGQMKQFIDRGHFVIEQLLHGKYAISVATGENYGSRDTSKVLSKLLTYSGARLSGKMVCNLPFNSLLSENRNIDKQTRRLANSIVKDIKYQKKYIGQAIIHKMIFSFGIQPFVKRKGASYAGVLNRWKQQRICKGFD